MEKFTIEEIREYLKSQDSLGDIMYNLSVDNIKKANRPKVCPECMEDVDFVELQMFGGLCETCSE